MYIEFSQNEDWFQPEFNNYLSNESITNLAAKLPDNFLRIHRGIIINKNYVNDIQKYFNSRFIITLNDKKATSITSGRSYNDVIKNWINL